MKTNLEVVTHQIQSYFKEKPEVVGVYLFGSFALARENKESDIDVAVLYQEGKDPGFEERLKMSSKLSTLLGRDVDLVFLGQVSCILRYQVLKYGKAILCHDLHQLNEFVIRTLQEYFDLKQVREPIERSLSKVSIYG